MPDGTRKGAEDLSTKSYAKKNCYRHFATVYPKQDRVEHKEHIQMKDDRMLALKRPGLGTKKVLKSVQIVKSSVIMRE